jgi:hypothetical protein
MIPMTMLLSMRAAPARDRHTATRFRPHYPDRGDPHQLRFGGRDLRDSRGHRGDPFAEARQAARCDAVADRRAVPPGRHQPRLALWQVGAGLYATYAGGVTPRPLPASPPPAPEDVTDRAVANGDEHAIKLTEACLRLNAEVPDPLFPHAAARASELLG